MISGKDRSYLKGLAHNLQPLLHIGKNGLSESFYAEADKILDDHELVKFAILDAADMKAKPTANEVAEALDAEFIQAVGKKFVLYRRSRTLNKEDRIRLP